uniref:Ubiquitin-like-conjugating enzyme ATG10 n=1 Tax=Globisporangium ultimum (strain ATCC 200006 / CBS 805.95 / DAOM BR144) TaxID=431595 RepID=K3XAD0_GLOUD
MELDHGKQTQTVICDFHIVYHVIYQTPVLYFRVTRLDGTPVRISAQIGGLRLPGSKADSTFVSVEEHPVLGTPFWFLHPCETSAAMELLLHQQCPASETASDPPYPKYLLAWLSLVQPLTRINPLSIWRR